MTGRWPSSFLGLLALAAVAGCDSLPGKPRPEDRPMRPDQVMDFKKLFETNCAGCHMLAPGHYEFKLAHTKYGEVEKDGKQVPVTLRDSILEKLESSYKRYRTDATDYGQDHRFPGGSFPAPPRSLEFLREGPERA